MAVSYDILSQFAKLVTKNKNNNTESTVYGTIIEDSDGNKYVKLDGSDQLTPLSDDERPLANSSTANANAGERVSVLIKNHTATVTGNVSSPAARTGDVEDLGDQVSEIQKFDIVLAERVKASEGYIENLQADHVSIGDLTAAEAKIEELEASKASIDELNAAKAEIEDLKVDKLDVEAANIKFATIKSLEATDAKIGSLKAEVGEFKDLTTEHLNAIDADIDNLSAENLNAQYAQIDFANIGEAAVEKFYAVSGIIKDLVLETGVVAKELVGVHINGDLIEANTLKADKLVVKGSDGLYYKLNIEAGAVASAEVTEEELQNGLHGSTIIAKTITAEKVNVSDLVAFGATIGGFKITDNSIYSGVKGSPDNNIEGIYLDSIGQIAFGDGDNFVKFYKVTDPDDGSESWTLDISAQEIKIASTGKTIEETIREVQNDINTIDTNYKTLIDSSMEQIELRATKEEVNEWLRDYYTKEQTESLFTVSSEDIIAQVRKEINENGATKVTTTIGTFDENGLTIEKTDAEMKTRISEDGIQVFQNDETMLTANSDGVDAKNLHATTYLIVGNNSRFEDYGNNRTGCFWIGG